MVTAGLVESVAADMVALSDLPREILSERWEQRFGCGPPKGCGRQLLELAAAYAIQEKALGGLNSATRRALGRKEGRAEIADTVSAAGTRAGRRSNAAESRRAIKPGTRLVREWNGCTHHVEVVQGGFVWNDRTHRSLSAIAREITGAQWSGPRFFGL